jgi:hypothetical protein
MDLHDITNPKDLAHQTDYWIEKHFEDLLYQSPHYRNLGHDVQQLILGLVKKYKEKFRHGIKPSYSTIKEDKYYFYEHRIKLGLKQMDLDQINDLLDSFLD